MASASVPEDFGKSNGTPISNKMSILSEIDCSLGQTGPPDLEYLFVEHVYTPEKLHSHFPLGHACVRYTYKGKQVVMNIVGLEGQNGSPSCPYIYMVDQFLNSCAANRISFRDKWLWDYSDKVAYTIRLLWVAHSETPVGVAKAIPRRSVVKAQSAVSRSSSRWRSA